MSSSFNKEEWKTIVGHSNYQISNFGRVKSLVTSKEKILKTQLHSKKGYEVITLNNITTSIHRLVAIHFIPNPENKPEVNHKDKVRNNNHVSNLEWCTHLENSWHRNDMPNLNMFSKNIKKKIHKLVPLV